MRTAIFPASLEYLDAIRTFATQAARDVGMNDADTYSVELSVDEACTNIIEHAYEGIQGGDIEITCDSDTKALTVIIRDHGKPFDPSNLAPPDLDADLNSRQVGGLGVFLMKKQMDEIRFEPLGEAGNVLTMVKCCKDGPEKPKTLNVKFLVGRARGRVQGLRLQLFEFDWFFWSGNSYDQQ